VVCLRSGSKCSTRARPSVRCGVRRARRCGERRRLNGRGPRLPATAPVRGRRLGQSVHRARGRSRATRRSLDRARPASTSKASRARSRRAAGPSLEAPCVASLDASGALHTRQGGARPRRATRRRRTVHRPRSASRALRPIPRRPRSAGRTPGTRTASRSNALGSVAARRRARRRAHAGARRRRRNRRRLVRRWLAGAGRRFVRVFLRREGVVGIGLRLRGLRRDLAPPRPRLKRRRARWAPFAAAWSQDVARCGRRRLLGRGDIRRLGRHRGRWGRCGDGG
jgi:hypothetical protein